MSCSGAGALRLLALLSSASAIVLRPREGCARADGVASEFCAGPLATHPLTAVAVAPALSSSECEHFISASEASALAGAGWRSVLRYDTKEVPLAEIPALQEWFERYGEARLLARIRETHLPQGVRSGALKLRLRDSNVVKYTNAPNGSRAVRPHSDGEDVFTFNVLLSSPSDFQPAEPAEDVTAGSPKAADASAADPELASRRGCFGVGTYFSHLNRTVTPLRGDAVTYYGGLVHSSGEQVGSGVRYVWQGFLTLDEETSSATLNEERSLATGDGHIELDRKLIFDARAALESAIDLVGPALARAGVRDFPTDVTLLANLCAVLGRAEDAQLTSQLPPKHLPDSPGGAESPGAARVACEAAIATEPSAGAFNNLGLLLARGGDDAAAELAFRSGLELCALEVRVSCPEAAEIWSNLGSLLRSDPTRSAEATEACEAAVQLAPDSAALLANLGAAQSEHEPAAARASYERALSIDPGSHNARFNLAVLLLRHGEADGAALAFEALLAAEPRDEGARMGLARALAELGRFDEAIALSRDGARLSALDEEDA